VKAILDTNICIYFIKNHPPTVRQHFSCFMPGDIGVSAITAAELHYGVAKSSAVEKNQAALANFLLPLEIIPFDASASAAYGHIRAELEKKGTPVGALDMLIAAQAFCLDALLVTHNLREFRRIPGLRCESWA
jgi:tRNA(fMet)-specific endonuclease VapC